MLVPMIVMLVLVVPVAGVLVIVAPLIVVPCDGGPSASSSQSGITSTRGERSRRETPFIVAIVFRIVQEHQVLVVPVADEPGAAARVFQRLADAYVNIKYSYLATGNRLVIAVDRLDRVADIISPA